MSDLIKIGALWVKESAKGKYMQGKFGDANLILFPNRYKKTDNHPDFLVYVAESRKKEDGNGGGSYQPETQSAQQAWLTDDDIPL